ncbi:MAG: TetR/AcrR family transcriptional regulator [Roseateles sp.]|nr:TetR family transcriptional regulator [Methylibium sp.]MBY0365730.1 TetR/AcrR family transcriptional regulator [Burkholderiaceae bacterium]|mmetsp:Transcript_53761/g.126791  ORF Transcript_53761/g.126791 Transcript_53761/m.126791 type:complete len:225 (+) Transcript_53761:4668-5342(+)
MNAESSKPPVPRAVGRPADPALATRLLDAGWQMFLARGVDAVSVESIAAQAGVSKATYYKHFADKQALFEAAVLREMERIEAAQQPRAESGASLDVRSQLRQFGIGLMDFLVSQPAVDFYKALAGELSRHKSLARSFYSLGPGRTLSNLAALMRDATDRGELVAPDAMLAAEHLIGLWQGLSNFQLSLGIDQRRIRSSIPERVEAGLRVFMVAYGPASVRQKKR